MELALNDYKTIVWKLTNVTLKNLERLKRLPLKSNAVGMKSGAMQNLL